MKVRELEIAGKQVKIITQADTELACDLFGMRDEVAPIALLLETAEVDGIPSTGGGFVCFELDGDHRPNWKGLLCRNRPQMNAFLIDRSNVTPNEAAQSLASHVEPWVEWVHGGRTYFALLIDLIGYRTTRFYWIVSCFEGHEWERQPT